MKTREKALAWWNELSYQDQFFTMGRWLLLNQGKQPHERHPNHLTGREIEEIYQNEGHER